MCQKPSPDRKRQQRGASFIEWHFVCSIPASPGGQEYICGINILTREKVSALQDANQSTVYHAFHCLTQTTSKTDRSVTSCLGAIPTLGFKTGITIGSFQVPGTELSVHILLYMDSRNSLHVGGRRCSIQLQIQSDHRTFWDSILMLRGVHPSWLVL